MEKYYVGITETLFKVVAVKANDEDEAWDIVNRLYKSSEIILYPDDYLDTEIDIYHPAFDIDDMIDIVDENGYVLDDEEN